MPMNSIVFMAILKHPSFAGVCVFEGSGSSTDGEYTGAEWTERKWTTTHAIQMCLTTLWL